MRVFNTHDDAVLTEEVAQINRGDAHRFVARVKPRQLGWSLKFAGALKPDELALIKRYGFRRVGRSWDRVDNDAKARLICLFRADYAYRNRPESYGLVKVIAVALNEDKAEQRRFEESQKLGGMESENNEIRIVEVELVEGDRS